MNEIRLIDAKAVLQKLQAEIERTSRQSYYSTGICDGLEFASALIEKETTVDAVPVKHGKWIIYNLYAQCSECSAAYDFDTFQRLIPMNEKFPRHCSYCGADMRGDANGN